MDLQSASNRLSMLDLRFLLDSLAVQVLWFRIMQSHGDWVISRHTHSSFEFHFVASGCCRVRLDKSEFIANEGEFYLTAPRVFHEQSSCGDGCYTEYSINVDISSTEEENEGTELFKLFSLSECRPTKDKYEGMNFFYEALKEAESQQIGYFNSIRALAAQILIAAARALGGGGKKIAVPLKSSGNDRHFETIRGFIEDNLSTHFTATDLSRHIYLSSRQISRIIRQHEGKSTQQFISSLRLQRAKTLLADTNLTVQEISEKLGFSSVYYFSQFFKREEGYPPVKFRSNVRKS